MFLKITTILSLPGNLLVGNAFNVKVSGCGLLSSLVFALNPSPLLFQVSDFGTARIVTLTTSGARPTAKRDHAAEDFLDDILITKGRGWCPIRNIYILKLHASMYMDSAVNMGKKTSVFLVFSIFSFHGFLIVVILFFLFFFFFSLSLSLYIYIYISFSLFLSLAKYISLSLLLF